MKSYIRLLHLLIAFGYTLVATIFELHILIPSAMAVESSSDILSTTSQPESGLISNIPASRVYKLSNCFEKADLNNKSLSVAQKNLAIAQAGIKIASAIPNPLLEVQLGFGPAFTYLFTGQTQQLFLTQEFQTAGKHSKNIALAKANYELSQTQFDALRFDIHNQIRRAYAELTAAEAYASLIENQRNVSIQLAQIAKKRFNAGKAPKSELLQAELNVLQFDTQRNQAQGRLEQDSAALALLMGDKPEQIEIFDVDNNGIFNLSAEKSDIVPSPNHPLPSLADLINTATGSNPSLKVAQQQIVVNRRSLTLARAQRIPDLFFGLGFTFSTFTQNQPPQLIRQPNWLGQGIFMNVSAESPLFYQHQGEIRQANSAVSQAEKQEDLLKSQITAATTIAYNSVSTAQTNIFIFQKDLLPTAAQVAKLARRSYEVGKTDLAAAIFAQQQYQQILSNYFDAVVSYQNSWADLEKAVGLPLKY